MGQRSDAEELGKSTSTDQHNVQKGNIIPEGADMAKTPLLGAPQRTRSHLLLAPNSARRRTAGLFLTYLLGTLKGESRTIKEEVASERSGALLQIHPYVISAALMWN